MSNSLNILYTEYQDVQNEIQKLQEKLKIIAEIITKHGGTIPNEDTKFNNPVCTESLKPSLNLIDDYPLKKSWIDKILFILKHFNKPMTANEIAEIVFDNENDISKPLSKIQNIVAVYTSKLSSNGKVEVNKEKAVNEYYFKQNI